ncbi:MAG: hypothetical protein AB1546_08665 [bacterium]
MVIIMPSRDNLKEKRDKRQKIDLREWVNLRGSDFVVKYRGGKPYISRKPRRNPNRRKSPGEQKQVDLFKLAVRYAREIITDPVKKAEYEGKALKQGKTVYNLAISDYLNRHTELVPRKKLPLKNVETEREGQYLFLKINLDEPVALKAMEVSILELGSKPVEKGKAEQATVTSWWYIVKNESIAALPFRVIIEAEGQEGELYTAQWVTV